MRLQFTSKCLLCRSNNHITVQRDSCSLLLFAQVGEVYTPTTPAKLLLRSLLPNSPFYSSSPDPSFCINVQFGIENHNYAASLSWPTQNCLRINSATVTKTEAKPGAFVGVETCVDHWGFILVLFFQTHTLLTFKAHLNH